MKIPLNWLKDYVKTDKSPRELADSFTALGLMLDKPLGDGKVLDLEHRMDRSDWLSIVGCARDLAAFEHQKLQLPRLTHPKATPLSKKEALPVTINCPTVIRRFTTRLHRGVKVGPSPAWLRDRLKAYGMDSINNIVDITNFVMIELGQPLHAQDLAKLPKRELTWRFARAGEKLTTFLGTELTLDPNAFIMTSGDQPIVLGGIIGGAQTGVTATTTDFVLDAGNYDQASVRHTSRRLHIANETVLRSDKFLDPRLTELALNRASSLILEIAGGTYSDNDDYYPAPRTSQQMTLRLSRLHLLSGQSISLTTVKRILTALGYVIVDQASESEITVEVPYFRTDVEVEDDLVADVLRISDYATLATAPLSTPVPSDLTSPLTRFEDKLRDLLVAAGAHEHITSSLCPHDAQQPSQVVLENALNAEASALRTSLVNTLRSVAHTYHKHQLGHIPLFEIGLSFTRHSLSPELNSFTEHRQLSILHPAGVNPILATLLGGLGINYDLELEGQTHQIVSGRQVLGTLTLDSATLDITKLHSLAQSYQSVISEFRRTTKLDLSLTLSEPTHFAAIKRCIARFTQPTSYTVLENHYPNLLLRLTWDQEYDYAPVKPQILEALLQEHHISSRSKDA